VLVTVTINEHADAGGGLSPTSDSANIRLQILIAEHWSLLSTRSLTYSESLSRVNMFLSVLSGCVVALALLVQVDRLRETFLAAAIAMLGVVLLVGVSTIVRLSELNREDLRSVLGMNRLRRGYLDMHPELEPYFLTDSHDDLQGSMRSMNMDMVPGRWNAHEVAHGFQTLPIMLSVIVAVVAGVLAALVAVWFGASTLIIVASAFAVFLVTVSVLASLTRNSFSALVREMPTRFPSTGTCQSGHP
jgi:hypothetical protein